MLNNIIILKELLIKNEGFDIGKLCDGEVQLQMMEWKNSSGLLKMREKYKEVGDLMKCMNSVLILTDHQKFFFFDFLMQVILPKTFFIFKDTVKFH